MSSIDDKIYVVDSNIFQTNDDNKKIIERNIFLLEKRKQNEEAQRIQKRKRKQNEKAQRKKTTKRKHRPGSVSSSLSDSSHVSSSSDSRGGRKRSMRRKRNGGKTMKRRMKK